MKTVQNKRNQALAILTALVLITGGFYYYTGCACAHETGFAHVHVKKCCSANSSCGSHDTSMSHCLDQDLVMRGDGYHANNSCSISNDLCEQNEHG